MKLAVLIGHQQKHIVAVRHGSDFEQAAGRAKRFPDGSGFCSFRMADFRGGLGYPFRQVLPKRIGKLLRFLKG
jgi:hypothetical protein